MIIEFGADFSAIPQDMAEVLGMNLKGKHEPIGGIGGELDAVKSRVGIKIENRRESYNFSMQTFVVNDLDDDFPVLIDRADFFNKFKITFNENNTMISLKRV